MEDIAKQKIWRYMDFPKFLYLLDRKSLFFTRLDFLEDQFEGSLPKKFFEQEEISTKNHSNNINQLLGLSTDERKFLRKCVAVNCWHVNEFESMAMWKAFTQGQYGIAIQSSHLLLKKALHDSDEAVWTAPLWYIDFLSELPEVSPWGLFRFKRKCFEYERELRAFVFKLPAEIQSKESIDKLTEIEGKGLSLKTDLSILIEKIYVNPSSPEWFIDLVNTVLKKYKVIKPVVKSELAGMPFY